MNKKNMSEMVKAFSRSEKYIKLIGIVATALFCVFYLFLHNFYMKEWTKLTSLGEYRLCYCLLIIAFGIYIRNNTLSFYRYNLLFMKSLGISNHYVCLAAFRKVANFYLIWQAVFLVLNAGLPITDLLGALIVFFLGGVFVFFLCVYNLVFKRLRLIPMTAVSIFFLLALKGILAEIGIIVYLLVVDCILLGLLGWKGNSVMIEFQEGNTGNKAFGVRTKAGKQISSKYKLIRHIKREIAVLFRSKSLLIAKIIIDTMLIALMFVSKNVLLNEIVCVLVVYLYIGFIEHLYIQDNQNRFLYFQLGESSIAFLLKKIATTLFFTGHVVVLFFIKAMLMRLQWHHFVLSCFVWLALVMYYSLYYFFMYTYLKDEYNSLHNILFLVITVLLFVPPFMFFAGIWFYISGKKRWEREKTC